MAVGVTGLKYTRLFKTVLIRQPVPAHYLTRLVTPVPRPASRTRWQFKVGLFTER